LAGVGEGKDLFAKAVVFDTGSKVGDLNGPTKGLLAVDIKQKPYKLIMGGENYEVYVYDGLPFKLTKTLHPHQHFVNSLAFNKDGS
jgi:hypothetical protein